MTITNESTAAPLVFSVLGEAAGARVLALLEPMGESGASVAPNMVDRTQFAAALNILLFDDLLRRVPSGGAYAEDVRAAGGRVCFDHGAIRTVCLPEGNTGALPRGELAFRRILEPLGYGVAAVYPLPALRMTGRAYCHRDLPETIPQFFVSELHVDKFDAAFTEAASRVFGTSRDPLDADAKALLARFAKGRAVPFEAAAAALPTIAAAFGRQHDRPTLSDYQILKDTSNEAAWIATEGNAFNHATDRVPDVEALAERQRTLGRPMKEYVEISGSGRVRQTAFRADMVERGFADGAGGEVVMAVPGSFYEFITRDIDPATGGLDLAFDSGNATGIFQMTRDA